MNDIDPVQFGELRADVSNLKTNVATLLKKMDEMSDLANKSKGAFWAGMTIASLVGGVASWMAAHFYLKAGG